MISDNVTELKNIISGINDSDLISRILVLGRYGSRLFGTATEESDYDYIAVYMPKQDDVLLLNNEHVFKKVFVNNNHTYDIVFISLPSYFESLNTYNNMQMLEMLFVDDKDILIKNKFYNEIRNNRNLFLSKDLNLFSKFARIQASKYSFKGAKYNFLTEFVTFLKGIDDSDYTVGDLNKVITNQYPNKIELLIEITDKSIFIFEKEFFKTIKLKYFISRLESMLDKYSERSITAANDGGVDRKALYHAVRVASETIELIQTKTLVFPLPYAKYLNTIRSGELSVEDIMRDIEIKLEQIDKLILTSHDLPDKIDRSKTFNLYKTIMKVYMENII